MAIEIVPRRDQSACTTDHDWSLHEHRARNGFTALRRCGRCGLTAINLPSVRPEHEPAHAAV